MPAAVDISLLGDKALERKLRRLEVKAQRTIVRQALREAAKIVAAAARDLVPVKTGALKRSIIVRALGTARLKAGSRRSRSELGSEVRTGTRAKLGIPPDYPWYYPASVEYGFTTSRGQVVPAHPYMRPALDNNLARIVASIRRDIAAGIIREAKRG